MIGFHNCWKILFRSILCNVVWNTQFTLQILSSMDVKLKLNLFTLISFNVVLWYYFFYSILKKEWMRIDNLMRNPHPKKRCFFVDWITAPRKFISSKMIRWGIHFALHLSAAVWLEFNLLFLPVQQNMQFSSVKTTFLSNIPENLYPYVPTVKLHYYV